VHAGDKTSEDDDRKGKAINQGKDGATCKQESGKRFATRPKRGQRLKLEEYNTETIETHPESQPVLDRWWRRFLKHLRPPFLEHLQIFLVRLLTVSGARQKSRSEATYTDLHLRRASLLLVTEFAKEILLRIRRHFASD